MAAGQGISTLTDGSGITLANGDLFEVTDISDTTGSDDGTSKQVPASVVGLLLGRLPLTYVAGSWHVAQNSMTTQSNTWATYNTERPTPIMLTQSRTFDRIGVYCDTLGSSTSTVRLGIRNNSSANGPGTLLLDAGTADCTTTGAKEITISQTLAPGIYWLSAVLQGSGSGAKLRGHTDGGFPQLMGIACESVLQTTAPSGNSFYKGSVTGALDDTGSFAVNNAGGSGRPCVSLRGA